MLIFIFLLALENDSERLQNVFQRNFLSGSFQFEYFCAILEIGPPKNKLVEQFFFSRIHFLLSEYTVDSR